MSNVNPIQADSALRLNYHDGMFLTAQNMTLEQNYFSNWIKLQNRFLYTAGVLNGLAVTLQNNTLVVAAGAALDDSGDFLLFSATSGNMLPPNSTVGNPYGLFLSYPVSNNNPTGATVDEAAFLQSASLALPPSNSVPLAEVELDQDNPGVIKTITDKRVGVTSRLPIVLSAPNLQELSAAPDLNGARHGTVSVDVSALLRPGDSRPQDVPYRVDEQQAFSIPPAVTATVLGSTPYAINLINVGTSKFTLVATAVHTRTDTTTTTLVNWLALPGSPGNDTL